MLKEQKGITLVALIITIIVMLILAGVSITLVVGDTGVLTQAQDLEPVQVQAELKQAVALANTELVADYYADSANYKGGTSSKYKTVDDIIKLIKDNYTYTETLYIAYATANKRDIIEGKYLANTPSTVETGTVLGDSDRNLPTTAGDTKVLYLTAKDTFKIDDKDNGKPCAGLKITITLDASGYFILTEDGLTVDN